MIVYCYVYLFVNMYGCKQINRIMKYVIIQVKMCLAAWAASMRVRLGTCCTRGSVTGTVL